MFLVNIVLGFFKYVALFVIGIFLLVFIIYRIGIMIDSVRESKEAEKELQNQGNKGRMELENLELKYKTTMDQLKSFQCPECHEIIPESDLKPSFYCRYCGQQVEIPALAEALEYKKQIKNKTFDIRLNSEDTQDLQKARKFQIVVYIISVLFLIGFVISFLQKF